MHHHTYIRSQLHKHADTQTLCAQQYCNNITINNATKVNKKCQQFHYNSKDNISQDFILLIFVFLFLFLMSQIASFVVCLYIKHAVEESEWVK